MAAIKERNDKFVVIYSYTDSSGTRKHKWDTVMTRKAAKARKAFVEYYQIEHGSVLVPEAQDEFTFLTEEDDVPDDSKPDQNITVKDFMEIFVDAYGVSTWSASTFQSKRSTINNYIVPYIGDWKLRDVTTVKLSKYYHDLLDVPEVPKAHTAKSKRNVQATNVKKIHDIIRCALNQAIKWEYLDPVMRNPATLATLPKAQKNKRKVWSVETFKQAVNAVNDDVLKLCMHLAFSCSMRYGEIAGLTWEDVIIDQESIDSGNARVIINKELARVNRDAIAKIKNKEIKMFFPAFKPASTTRLVLKTPKTQTSNRTVWLPKSVATLLVEYKKSQQQMKEFLGIDYQDFNLVIAMDNGRPIESDVILACFHKLCEANGFEQVCFHSLRHLSTRYKLKMTGGDIKSVQGDTGHAEAEMVTDVYSEIVDEDRRHNAEKMEEEFYKSLAPEPEKTVSSEEQKLLELLKSLPEDKRRALLNLSN